MNTHKTIEKMLIAYMLGELTPQQDQQVQFHLAECKKCKSELERLENVLSYAQTMHRQSFEDATAEAAKAKLFNAVSNEKTKQSAGERPSPASVWRLIMKSKITKLAAAAVIIIAVLIGIEQFGGKFGVASVAWGDVVRPILNARTAMLDIIVGSGENQPVIHDEIMGSCIRRTLSIAPATDIIIDFDKKKIMTLDSTKKTVMYIGLEGLDKFKNYVEILRDTINRFQSNADFHVENKGLQKIASRDCVVLVADSNNQTITIWADPKTALPIRIEQKTPNMQIVCDNMQFDVTLDESRFSMEAPADYTVIQNAGIDFQKSSESDFIESLQIWADIIEGGHFPDSIKIEDIVKNAPKFGHALENANLTQQQQIDTATRWAQGIVFIRFFKGQGQWHYAGKGVKLGDSNEPIFWYQPQASRTWRVIYGDLTVDDVNQDELTKLEADSAARVLSYDKQPKPVTEDSNQTKAERVVSQIINNPNKGMDITGMSREDACKKIVSEYVRAVIDGDWTTVDKLRSSGDRLIQWKNLFTKKTSITAVVEIGAPRREAGVSFGIVIPVTVKLATGSEKTITYIVAFRNNGQQQWCVIIGTWGSVPEF
jgi:hypothetical protein